MAEILFDVREVVYRYQDTVTALNGVSFSVAQGSRLAILGANGSGKSTLLRILDGLYFPDRGTVQVFGESLTQERFQDEEFAFRFRRRIAFVFQNPDVQLFNPTVFDEIAFGPLQLRWPKTQIHQRVEETLALLEITHLKDRPPHRLSGGGEETRCTGLGLGAGPRSAVARRTHGSARPQEPEHGDRLSGRLGGHW